MDAAQQCLESQNAAAQMLCKVLSLKCDTNQSTPFLSPVSLRIQFSWKKKNNKTALQWRTGKPGMLKSVELQRADTTERLNNRQLWSKGQKVAQAGGQKCRNWDISYKPQENTSTSTCYQWQKTLLASTVKRPERPSQDTCANPPSSTLSSGCVP